MKSPGTATISPIWVVIRASDIPAAKALVFAVPKREMASNVEIIPAAVPSSPRSGATEARTKIKF